MSRKFIACLLIISLASLNILTPAQAFWPFGSSEPNNKDMRFSTVYPVSFWKSTTGKILIYTGIAVIIATTTYFTAGTGTAASAGVIAKFIGGAIGSWVYGLSGGAAINAGLALLGGGAVAAGGLGIIGGVSVLSAVGSVALAAAIDTAIGQIPSGTHQKSIMLIKPRLLRDNVSPAVKDEMKELYDLLDEIAKGGTQAQANRVVRLMEQIDGKLARETRQTRDEYTAYNYLFMAIIRYNLNKFGEARESIRLARRFTDSERSSVVDYVDAMLAFQAGDDKKAVNLLRSITEAEPKASTPYIVLGQYAFDEGRYHEAFDIIERGIKAGCDEVCVMNWMAGNSLYNAGSYKAAVPYYKTALKNMTINEIEALYKLNIAKCYRKLRDNKEGEYWLDDAISEVKDNSAMAADLRRQYYSD